MNTYQRGTGHHGLVVTDVRYANEAAMLRNMGGHIVRVHRPDLPPLATDTAAHDSEVALASVHADIELHNDGDLQHLVNEAWRVVNTLAAPAAPTPTPTEGAQHG